MPTLTLLLLLLLLVALLRGAVQVACAPAPLARAGHQGGVVNPPVLELGQVLVVAQGGGEVNLRQLVRRLGGLVVVVGGGGACGDR